MCYISSMKHRHVAILAIIMTCLVTVAALGATPFAQETPDATRRTYKTSGYYAYSNAKKALPYDIYLTYFCVSGTCEENLPPCTVIQFNEKQDMESQRYVVYIAMGGENLVKANQKFQRGVYLVDYKLTKGQYLVLKSVDSDDEIVLSLADQT